MEILTQLTPAEVLLLRNLDKASLKELCKVTFMDLIVRQVLQIADTPEHEEAEATAENIFIEIGSRFNEKEYHPHETPFLAPYLRNDTLSISLKGLIREAVNRLDRQRKNFIALLRTSPMVAKGFKNGWWYRFMNILSLTPEGKEMKKAVEEAIEDLQTQLPELIEKEPQQATELIKRLGGNVFLLDNFDFQILNTLDEGFRKQISMYTDLSEIDFIAFFLLVETSLAAMSVAVESIDTGVDASGGFEGGIEIGF